MHSTKWFGWASSVLLLVVAGVGPGCSDQEATTRGGSGALTDGGAAKDGVASTDGGMAGGDSSGVASGDARGDENAEDASVVPPPPPVTYDAGGPIGTWVNVSPPGTKSAVGIALSPAAPNVLYVNAYSSFPPQAPNLPDSGIYKSIDGGNSWTGPIGTSFLEHDGTTYSGPYPWKLGVSWTITVDPTDADVVYAMCSFAGPQGPWKSTDGGNTWRKILSGADAAQMTPDIYAIAIDPRDHLHLLMTFHSGWALGSHAGIAESTDGGATWIKHPAQGSWGAGHYAFFLGRDDAGNPSSSAWILATQSNGFWRTMDAGQTFEQVSSQFSMQHGAGGLYRASTGVLYMGAVGHLIRSTDNGKTWSDSGAPSNSDGYNAIMGDGVRMYVQSANTGTNTTGPQPFYTSLETDGQSWTAFNQQTFADGPGWMAADPVNKVVFAANWDHNLWRLRTGN